MLVTWLAAIRDGKLHVGEDAAWIQQAVNFLPEYADKLLKKLDRYITRRQRLGPVILIPDREIQQEMDDLSMEVFTGREILRRAMENARRMAPEAFERIKKTLDEYVYDLDATFEAYADAFFHLAEYAKSGESPGLEDTVWWDGLMQAHREFAESAKGIPVEEYLKDFRENWHPDNQLLQQYVMDELLPARREVIDIHLQDCKTCRDRVNAMITEMDKKYIEQTQGPIKDLMALAGRIWSNLKDAVGEIARVPMPTPVAAAGPDGGKGVIQALLGTLFGGPTLGASIIGNVPASAFNKEATQDLTRALDPRTIFIEDKNILFADQDIEVGLAQTRNGILLIVARPRQQEGRIHGLELRNPADSKQGISGICKQNGCVAVLKPQVIADKGDFRLLIRVDYNGLTRIIGWR